MPTPTADLVLRGGPIHTFTTTTPATAIAIRSGVVMRVGNVDSLIGPGTDVVELSGRAVIPGINDAHLHAVWLGALWPDTLLDSGMVERPLRTGPARRTAILRAGSLLASLGITSYTEPGLGPGEDDGSTGAFGTSVVEEYRRLAAEGLLRARVTGLWLYGELDGRSTLPAFLAGLTTESVGDPRWLNFRGVKIFADGIPPMRTSYTRHCYADGSRPSLLVDGGEEALTAMVLAAHHAGLQVGVHATGDRAVEVFLDAVTRARASVDVDLRHYVIHGDLVDSSQLARMARLGVGLSTQAGIAVRTFAGVREVLGVESAWRLTEALAVGVRMCLTSDAPVLPPDWRLEIATADAWMGAAGDPRSRMETLLRCYTVHPAWQDGVGWKGTLGEGMAADLCVLAADPFELTAAELPDVDVDMTVVDGRVVFER